MSFPTSHASTCAWVRIAVLATALLFSTNSFADAACPPGTQQQLQQLLAPHASITQAVPAGHERWSQYAAPHASLYVVANEERDVATVIQFANRREYDFLVRNGGNGWADTFRLVGCSIIIDISQLNRVTFNHDRSLATIQGGVGVKHLVDEAYANNARVATATCNCVGFLGGALGGGQTRQAGLYGLSVDQLVSMNVVLASGESIVVDAKKNAALWWALRGAGPNFGIITSATIKSYAVPAAANTAWTGLLTYSESQLKQVMQTISKLELQPNMQLDFEFATTGPPAYAPLIGVLPFYIGDTADAEAAFAPLLTLGPTSNSAQQTPYNQWNGGSNFCDKGPRKPAYGASLARIDPSTWVEVYREFKAFVASNPAAFGGSTIVSENYATAEQVAIGRQAPSSYPFRDLGSHVIALPSYTNASHDAAATAWAARIQALWWSTAGTAHNSTYINFAHGSEPLSSIYGDSLTRLRQLKKIYDPLNRFNQWFSLA